MDQASGRARVAFTDEADTLIDIKVASNRVKTNTEMSLKSGGLGPRDQRESQRSMKNTSPSNR
jgi:hypothetical protein